jgi:5,10-methylenetetrahydromethanopterin reductase
MKLGVAFLGGQPIAELVASLHTLESNQRVEAAWVADERFHRDVWIQLAVAAGVTRRLQLGVCVTDAFIRHPALTATAAATLEEIAPGRLRLGLGAGSSGLRTLGIDGAHAATVTEEAVALIRTLWSAAGTVSHHGRRFRYQGAGLGRRPSTRIPIWIAARGPAMLRLAGRVADAALIGNFCSGPGLDYALAHVESGRAQRSPELGRLQLASWLYISVDPDSERAREAVKRGVALAVTSSARVIEGAGYRLPSELAALAGEGPVGYGLGERARRVAALVPDALAADLAVAGTAAECAERIRRLEERGVDEVAVLPYAPDGVPLEEVVRRLTDEVMPLLDRVA